MQTRPTPDIDGDACVHAMSPHASCCACVDACPSSAWLLDDDGLSLDTALCDGCALCVPACPRDALALARPVSVLHDAQGHGTAFATCERAVSTGVPQLACAHALGPRDLDALAAQNVGNLTVLTGECAACSRAPAGASRPSLSDAAAAHATIAASQGRAIVRLEHLDARTFARQYARAAEDQERINRSRRRLFSAFLSAVPAPATPAEGDALAYHAPMIDEQRCVACDACWRICPDGALLFQAQPAAYVSDPAACTGCGLCVDSCDSAAIRIHNPGNSAKKTVLLDLCRCRKCGAPYHRVIQSDAPSEGDHLCRICARTSHHKKLFQVFKD